MVCNKLSYREPDSGTHKESLNGGIHAAYGYLFPNNFFIGIEGSISLVKTKQKMKDSNNSNFVRAINLHFQDKYATSIKMGKIITRNNLVYLKIGVAYSYLKTESHLTILTTTLYNKKFFAPGFDGGLEISIPLNNQFLIGGEFSSTFYRHIKFNHKNVLQYQIRPRQHSFKIKFTYKI